MTSASIDPHAAVLAESTRNGIVECRYRGSAVALDADGTVVLSLGTPEQAIYGRSANKPMQAAAMVSLGLELPSELLALVIASHSGERHHVELAQRILTLGGFTERDLKNAVFPPLGRNAEANMYRHGDQPSQLTADCSGKHAGMLLTAKANGWSTQDYLRADHPLQQAITETIAQYSGETAAFIGVDGCGAPAHGISVTALARSYARLVSENGQIARAMRAYPANVGGEGRDVTRLMQLMPGVIAKDGADGVLAVSASDGRTVALQMGDGSLATRVPVALDILEAIGVDVSGANELRRVTIFGGGKPVGEIRSVAMFSHSRPKMNA